MHMRYFGDSYDIVKQSLIRWLGEFGDWSVHPMLTESATVQEVEAFGRFLGARIICTQVLTTSTDRESYLAGAANCGNVFLDPDTGFSLAERRPKEKYLFKDELIHLATQRPQSLTLVFDQSLARGSERKDMEHKLSELQSYEISCFAYISHAAFVVCSSDAELIDQAVKRVIAMSRLPERRFLLGVGPISGNDPGWLRPGNE